MGFIKYYGHKIYLNEGLQKCLTDAEKASGAVVLDYMPDYDYMRNNPQPDEKQEPQWNEHFADNLSD